MADGMEIDMQPLRDLGADFRRAGAAIEAELPAEIGVTARELATLAQGIAGGYQSADGGASGGASAVAASIKAIPKTKSSWVVQAGGADVPLAGLWELGNKGSDSDDPTFRHKTFGKLPWQNQQKWPYLRMALQQYEPAALSKLTRFFDSVLRRFRL